jgi:hypothetical protein
VIVRQQGFTLVEVMIAMARSSRWSTTAAAILARRAKWRCFGRDRNVTRHTLELRRGGNDKEESKLSDLAEYLLPEFAGRECFCQRCVVAGATFGGVFDLCEPKLGSRQIH